jgi:hypothetical protein
LDLMTLKALFLNKKNIFVNFYLSPRVLFVRKLWPKLIRQIGSRGDNFDKKSELALALGNFNFN